MSILFYKKPEYVSKEKDLSASSCQKYVERAACSRAAIPDELSFDNVIEDKALPPCTLQDFLDYLVYVAHDAENLQFFLWLRDYTRRFNNLPAAEKALSQPWVEPVSFPTIFRTNTQATDSQSNIPITPSTPNTMKPLPEEPISPLFFSRSTTRLTFSRGETQALVLKPLPRLSTETTLRSPALPPPPSPITASAQPFRDEIDRITDHYLVAGAPRELNLSGKDRKIISQALSYTTHPSAMASIGQMCEQTLRHHSHRNFVRWSICNGNRPRVFVLRSIAVLVLLAVIILCAFLIMSPYKRWYRLAVAPILFFGSVNLIAARQGLCVLLHRRHTRERRPWEIDVKAEARRQGSGERVATGLEATPWDEATPNDGGESGQMRDWRGRLAALGPRNEYEHEPWVQRWRQRNHWQKIRVQKVRIDINGGLRMIQNRVVWQAEAWGLLVTLTIIAAVCAFPEFGLY